MTSDAEHGSAYAAVLAALDNAPIGEPLSPEERVELDQIMLDIAAGRRVLVRNEDVPAWLEAHEEGALAAHF